MKLFEILKGDSTKDISWNQVSPIKKIGEFEIGDEFFGITFTNFKTEKDIQFKDLKNHYDLLLISFGLKKEDGKYSHKMRNTSSFPSSVLNTIITAITKELKQDQTLVFFAKRTTDTEEEFQKRKKFYEMLAKLYERKEYNLKMLSFDGKSQAYFLSKNELIEKDLNILFTTLGHKLDKK